MTTNYAAAIVAYQHYQNPVRGQRCSYEEFVYEMLSFLRFLPKDIQSKPMAFRIKEEIVRNLLAHLICTRRDLVEYYFERPQLTAEAVAEMWHLFEEKHSIPTQVSSDERLFHNRDIRTKKAICNLINNLVTKDDKQLLTPVISLTELERLLSDGNCEHQYICNNQQWLAFIMHHLAHNHVLQKSCYWKTLCSHGKLHAPGHVLNSEGLSNAYNQIRNKESTFYHTITETLNKILQ